MKGNNWRKRPDAGQRLLPHVIDDLAKESPDRILFEEASHTHISHGFRKTTCKAFSNAINKTAWWLEETLGGRGLNFDTVGYLGPCDSRYMILVVAAIKSGYKMLFVSPRNSLDGHIAVVKASKCKIWLQPSEEGSLMDDVLKHCPNMKIYSFPDLNELHSTEMVEHYPYTRTWQEGKWDPGWVLHTSGSTGLPKPIIKPLMSASITEAHRLCEPVDGRPILLNDLIGARIYVTLPPFHSLGLNTILYWPIYYDQTIILGPHVPVTVDVMADMINETLPDAMITSPSLLEAWSETFDDFKILGKLKAIGYGGGPLSQSVGDIIALETHLITILGSTESGWLTAVETDPEDWNYLRFHPNAGLELRPGSGGLYELFVVRSPELAQWQTIFSTFPELQEYAFSDLFSRHPSKRDLWHHEGRIDNIIVLSNGEKFNPDRLEQRIAEHPLVRTIIVAGYGRFQTSAIIELKSDPRNSEGEADEASIIDSIWPAVIAANEIVESHGRLQKAFIMLASPQKPFLRASKGTVQRAQTLDMYSGALDDLYAKNESQVHDISQIDVSTLENLRLGISDAIRLISGSQDLDDEKDIFDGSFDSLQVLTLLRRLRVALRDSFSAVGLDAAKVLTASLIYGNPTSASLTESIHALIAPSSTSVADSVPSHIKSMSALISKYSSSSTKTPSSILHVTKPSQPARKVALITGSTGSLGSYILEAAIQSGKFVDIWCFNRPADITSRSRQEKSNLERGLTTDWELHTCKIHFVEGDLCEPDFGLLEETFGILKNEVTHIFHNAWNVNFNLTLPSFSSQIAGTAKLIDFASLLPHRASLLFVSSIGAVNNWANPDDLIPEIGLEDLTLADRGYGQSKLVTEILISEAVKSSSNAFGAKICRVGQLAGPVGYGTRGVWNRKEWFPTIISASAFIGLLPSTLGNAAEIDWIPVDIMGEILVELALTPKPDLQESLSFYHGVNSHSCSWSEKLVPIVRKILPNVSLVTWKEWVSALSSAIGTAEDVNKVPGAPLLAFFEGIGDKERSPKLDTTKIMQSSSAFRNLRAVDGVWMELWMKQWGY